MATDIRDTTVKRELAKAREKRDKLDPSRYKDSSRYEAAKTTLDKRISQLQKISIGGK